MQSKSDTGSRGYLVSIVMVAVLGGLLFGYDTAVISGADKGLPSLLPRSFRFPLYRLHARLHFVVGTYWLHHRQCPVRTLRHTLRP